MNKGAYIISGTLVVLFFAGLSIFALQMSDTPVSAIFGGTAQADTIQVNENIVYGTKERNRLDLFIPAGIDKAAEHGLILYIHGGSWTSGDKSSMVADCKSFAEKGYITATMNYSFLNFSAEEKTDFTTMLGEIAAALATIKGYASAQGINITKAAVSGYSAGAHLAMLYAYSMMEKSPLPILFVQSKAGPADYRTFSLDSPDIKDILGRMGNSDITPEALQSEKFAAMLQALSPVTHIKSGVPPTLMAYGRQDTLVTWENALSLMNAFNAFGVKYTLVEYPQSGHGLDKDADSTVLCNEKMAEFAKQYFGY